MKISDIIVKQEPVEDSIDLLDIKEIEKTAELLEALSEEDTLLDELAKLAVFQDYIRRVEKVNRRT